MTRLCKKTVEFQKVQKTQGFGRVARATAVSRRQVSTIQTVQKSSKMRVAEDHEVSVDASVEQLKGHQRRKQKKSSSSNVS